ncbi:hypothetical protein [Lederbergia citrea]|uniref:hypothetical protein n=2 Tax=Lederbergia citrea TaxID=2833581 RepID=UPI001BCA670C|nr:hypothetical protein [Lederbergia citrea]MBS4176698.1 hypothetical protein [Lederbergia citrea]MBS4203259.1 hypothetical protein [Lederbergia citrea]
MLDTRPMSMSVEEKRRLLDWWKTMESAKLIVQRLVSQVSELRLHPESSHADGMILFYRAISEISYGYAGVRGGVRREFTSEYSEGLQINMVMCHSFAPKFAVDAKILLERIAKQITGPNALILVEQIRVTLFENDMMLNKLEKKAHAFFGKKNFQAKQKNMMQDMTLLG